MSFLHRVKVMFGLADDYDDYEEDEYYDPDEEPVRQPYQSPYAAETSVRRIQRGPDLERAREVASSRGRVDHIRPVEERPHVKMHIAEPKSFSEAQTIADRFKDGTPVIMNLSGTDPDLSKRLIDFASGLTYGLSGGLKKVSDKVFMLTPHNVDVSAEDRRRLKDSGLFTFDT